jgi:hypothetical protein
MLQMKDKGKERTDFVTVTMTVEGIKPNVVTYLVD